MIMPVSTVRLYQIKVTLKHTKPPIWRRIQVLEDISLAKLHRVLQIVMGWYSCHLHQFIAGGRYYGVPDPDYDDFGTEMLDERKFRLCELLLQPKRRIRYEYDFGDGWDHELFLEKILSIAPGQRYPVCLAGAMACPLEDSGGPWGYYEKLEIIKNPDPDNIDHQQIVDWVPANFDPTAFDLNWVNAGLKRVR